MRVCYIACNPAGQSDLMIEREITELQRLFLAVSGEPVEFLAFPKLPVEELPLELAKHKPDVLHVSAHGAQGLLEMANSDNKPVKLTGEVFRAWLNMERPPRLVYLNACNSIEMAKALVGVVPMAIGTTAPITNRAARAAALIFYDRLLAGSTVQNAYEACQATIKAIHDSRVSCELFPREDVNPTSERLYHIPRVVARFHDEDYTSDSRGNFDIEVGILGCPGNTSQIVFFTDDESFAKDAESEKELATGLCRVVKTYPVDNIIWSEEEEAVYGDYRIFAAGVTGAGETFIARSTLCDALNAYYRLAPAKKNTVKLENPMRLAAIAQLRSMNGAWNPLPSATTPRASAKRSATRKK